MRFDDTVIAPSSTDTVSATLDAPNQKTTQEIFVTVEELDQQVAAEAQAECADQRDARDPVQQFHRVILETAVAAGEASQAGKIRSQQVTRADEGRQKRELGRQGEACQLCSRKIDRHDQPVALHGQEQANAADAIAAMLDKPEEEGEDRYAQHSQNVIMQASDLGMAVGGAQNTAFDSAVGTYTITGDELVLELMTKYFRWEMTVPEDEFLPPYWQQQRAADNLVSGDTNAQQDVCLDGQQTGQTLRV